MEAAGVMVGRERVTAARGPIYFGRYRGVPLACVPEDYLRWLFRAPWCHDDVRRVLADHLGEEWHAEEEVNTDD